MQFNIVIGNPPYNRGMDLDFVDLSFDLSTKYVIMITPAKWQTAEDTQRVVSKVNYKQFRQTLVPHMSVVVFYPDCADIFNISQTDGISYFLLDKKLHTKCYVTNICNTNKNIYSKEYRSILNGQTLWNIGNKINEILRDIEKFKFNRDTEQKEYYIVTDNQVSKGGGARGGVGIFNNAGNFQCVGISEIYTNENIQSASIKSAITFKSNNIDECKSFISWLNTKFTRFLIAINISKFGPILTDNYFRFVPIPTVLDKNGNKVVGKFDHIYTDDELYKTFNLPQEYIDIIESIIKERK